MQVHVADVGSQVAGPCQPYHGVEVRSVEIDLAAMIVDRLADVAHAFLEDAVGRRIGDHQRSEMVGMLRRLRLQVLDVDIAVVQAADNHHAHAGHRGAGRIGSVRG